MTAAVDSLPQALEQQAEAARDLVVGEMVRAVGGVAPTGLAAAADLIEQAERVFVLGVGRSGIALRAFAMRLMHLGLDTHVIGETTAPAVRAGDLLIVASGSGTTESVVRSASKAAELGVSILAITSAPRSPLAAVATEVVTVQAAVKTDHGSDASQQYAGSLFEQAVLVIGDTLFHLLWQRSGADAEVLWPRHANLE